jgi:hypothetical protein
MVCEWIALTSQDTDKPIYVSLANASAIEPHKKGATIFFAGNGKESAVYVSEAAEEILERSGEMQRVNTG